MADDYTADTSTTGKVTVGGSVTGNIEVAADRDWFKVSLVAGMGYIINLEGFDTNKGTLSDPVFSGIYDSAGALILNTLNDDSGTGRNSQLFFTAPSTGLYYLSAGAFSSGIGTYTLSVTQDSFPTFTAFAAPVAAGKEDTEIPIAFANLQTQGNEADADGTVTAFVVKTVSSGTLKIGTSAATAILLDKYYSSFIDATHQAYWTPAADANGTFNAFTAVAMDNLGFKSATAVQATVAVTPVINVVVSASSNTTEGAAGSFTISLDQAAPVGGLSVNYTLSGSAIPNTDYTVSAGTNTSLVTSSSFVIAEGQTSATLNVNALTDTLFSEPNESVALMIGTGAGYDVTKSFLPKVDYATNNNPASVNLRDFNGDGKLDLATINSYSATVSVLLRNAENTGFDAKTDYFLGIAAYNATLGVGDFNGDGKADLAVTDHNNAIVSVLLGNAANTGFGAKVNYAAGTAGSNKSVSVGDFNGDGKLDLAVTDYTTATVSVLLRNAANTGFNTKVDYAVGTTYSSKSVSVGDFNGDGKLDLAVTNQNTAAVAILLRNAANTGFDAAVAAATGASPNSVSAGDFNEDGKLDLAVANYGDSTVSVLLNNDHSSLTIVDTVGVSNHTPTGTVTLNDITPETDQTLTVSNTLADADGLNAITYTWQVAGQTVGLGDSYTVDSSDAGKTIQVLASYVDGLGKTETVTSALSSAVTLAVNAAPTGSATAVFANGTEDTLYNIAPADLLTGFSDTDSALSVINLKASHGKLSTTASGYVFKPAVNYNGVVTLSYQVTDGVNTALSTTRTLTLNAVNDAPKGSATAVLANGSENIAYPLKNSDLLTGFTDADGNALSVINLTSNHGTVAATSTGWTLTPTSNYYGAVALTYQVSDGSLNVAATQSLTLANVNTAPTGSPTTVLANGTEDVAYTLANTILLQGFSDAEGDTLSVTNLTATNGTVAATTTGWTLTPNANYNGLVTLNYSVTDGTASIVATKTLTLNAVNDAPTGSPTAVLANGTEDVAYTLANTTLLQGFSDVEGNTLSVTGLTATNSTITATTTGWTFTPNANYNGLVTLSYRVTDGAASLAVTKNMTLNAVNDAPTGAVAISDTTPEQNQILTASNTLADVDGLGTVTYTWKTGTAVLGTGSSYTVTAAEVGKTIAVTASYTDAAGNAESISSAATSAVTPPAVVTPAGVNIVGSDFFTNEQGDTAVFKVSLNSAPLRDVTLNFISSDTTEGVLSQSSFTFTAANWATAQTLTVTGQNDTLVDGDIAYTISATASTLDVIYKSITVNNLTLTNQDTVVVPVENIIGTNGIDQLQGSAAPTYMLGQAGDDDLSGGAGNDTLYGSYGNDVMFGEDGNDQLWGEQDADYMEGGAGNDTLDGGTGIDTLIGGAGNDTYYLGYDAVDVIDDKGLTTDVDTVIMPYQLTSYTLPTDIENGTIDGTGASDLTGNGGDNTLKGNSGNNQLIGAVGRDMLFAGGGDDVVIGGDGNDTLEGGLGIDVFRFDSALTSGFDTINDFTPADDTIQLENAIFTKLTLVGTLAAARFVNGTAALDANDNVIYNPSTGVVSYDADGSGVGAAVQIALLGVTTHPALTAADFVVV